MTIEECVAHLKQGGYKCVAASEQEIVFTSCKKGIAPMLDLYNQVQSSGVKPVYLADRVFGRGAVFMAKLCGVQFIFSEVASEQAMRCAAALGIHMTCSQQVPYIMNAAKTGRCPIESAVMDCKDTEIDRAYEAILNKVASFSKQ